MKTPQTPKKLPLWSIILYLIALFCLGLYIAFTLSPTFADFFNQHVSSVGRWILATLTAWIPFSLGELVICLLPLALVVAIRHAFRYYCDTWRSAFVFVGCVLSLVATVFSIFTINFAAGYRGKSLDEKLGMTKSAVSAQELYATAEYLKDKINQETANIMYTESGFSAMPYTLGEMREHLDIAYADFCQKHDFISHSPGVVKPVLLSEGMSYLHITGIYTFFTGEANINVVFPDYSIPFTAAHEMAHQRGISREDEANFVAFLVCVGSSDPYLRYCGYLNLYEYLLSALSYADYDLYLMTTAHLNPEVRGELSAYAQFYEKYRHSVASNVSGAVNDTFLQSQGTVGTQSYGMVVDLAVAYLRENASPEGE